MPPDQPNFRSHKFLLNHIESILAFYNPNIIDQKFGGYHQNFYDNGSIFSSEEKHIVSTTRIIFNYCKAYLYFKNPQYLSNVERGLTYLRDVHWDNNRCGYHWALLHNQASDQTNYCYGLAFVLLAYANCYAIGIESTEADIYATWDLMETRLWQPTQGVYADDASPDWSKTGLYRGQNANMHCCEAMLAAFQATKDQRFLDRAYQLAQTVTVQLADKAGGLIWEHYTPSLDVDWDCNIDDPLNLKRPWGFQSGHQTEWSKLLLTLYKLRPEPWMVERAESLFKRTMATSWDEQHGGLVYTITPEGKFCDGDKYYWVQAESIAAAARLASVTKSDEYWLWYDKIWAYVWEHMVDHKYGGWYRILTQDNQKYTDIKSPAGNKCDYHTMGACWEVIEVIG